MIAAQWFRPSTPLGRYLSDLLISEGIMAAEGGNGYTRRDVRDVLNARHDAGMMDLAHRLSLEPVTVLS